MVDKFIDKNGISYFLQKLKKNIIDDKTVSAEKTYSSKKLNNEILSTKEEITIQPNEWKDGVYTYRQTLVGSPPPNLITNYSNQEILPPVANGTNNEMIEAIENANLKDAGQGSGSLSIRCFGEIPTIPITLRIIFRGRK